MSSSFDSLDSEVSKAFADLGIDEGVSHSELAHADVPMDPGIMASALKELDAAIDEAFAGMGLDNGTP